METVSKHGPFLFEIRTRKTASRVPDGAFSIRSAFAKEMRKYNKTKRIYPIDPYAEVYQFRSNLYAIYTESLDGMGDPWIYLIIGPEKAMLIDTGFGLGDLKGLADEITGGMPLIVANTHFHFDHAYGNFQFDKVYCHENEAPLLESVRNPHIWDYLFDENGKGRWADFDRNDLVPFAEYEIVGVPDNYIFDLGGSYKVELMYLPGHSAGHSAYLDKENRILFGGDETCYGGPLGIMGPVKSLAEVRDQLAKIVARIDEIDAIFPGHGPVDMEPQLLFDILNACNAVIANPQDYDRMTKQTFGGVTRKIYGKSFDTSNFLNYSLEG